MRNFKFRGKVINNPLLEEITVNIGDFVYGNLIVVDNGECFITIWKTINGSNYESKTHQVDPKTIGQYIGLNDNKTSDKYPEGQEIYEGDSFYYNDVLRKVVYREDNTSWMGTLVKNYFGKCNFYLKDITNNYENRLNATIISDDPKL